MSLAVGIVGLPNVGKSTLFNALLKRQAALAANYPFATIEPNVGVVPVPDSRLAELAKVVGTEVIKPATVEFVDIAGLVRGAHRGEGLGNKFLHHIRETNLICQVLRAFDDQRVAREGAVDPAQDLATVRAELMLADLATLDKQAEPKGVTDRTVQQRWRHIQQLRDWLSAEQLPWQQLAKLGQSERPPATPVTAKSATAISTEPVAATARELNLLTAKPELIVLNVSESQLAAGIAELTRRYAAELTVPAHSLLVMSNLIESELSSLSAADQQLYLRQLGLEQSGLERLVTAAYRLLSLQSFLTAGEKEVRAWTISRGTTARQAAAVIHSDFAQKMINAQVINYTDFLKAGGWKPARDRGLIRTEGRDYLMRPDDVVEFRVGR
ncbi:MAG: redox-regulated ATPase YchF [Candidatus Pacebacteria bacterium CG10_big_fil_rev_8_21_14_0_10_56_10]|nr:MAG: redox-regulated ATPase YchF [Candidatus Pacebacteria bacterium CG10_big_fil_rev_8_21_14_0_10_56_10]